MKNKVKELWSYFRIQDEDVVVVPSYNGSKQRDEYFVARKENGNIVVEVYDGVPEQVFRSPFLIVSAVGDDGRHVIPSVSNIIKDKEYDY